jgi:hypothetical protein
MIRLEGAEVLCNSLRTNKVLTSLDLSYNALGSAAAGVLGAALINNNVRTINNVQRPTISQHCSARIYALTHVFMRV